MADTMTEMRSELSRGTRRRFLWEMGAGFAGVALNGMLQQDGFFAQASAAGRQSTGFEHPMAPQAPHFAPRAKACIFLFMYGGPPSMDTWDYKPELQRRDGQKATIELRRRYKREGTLLASRQEFRRYGKSGLWCANSFPHIAKHMDELCVIKSLYADTFAHGSALIQMNSGRVIQGSPTIGSWLTYGLGSENQNLPGYIVMLDPRGGPISGAANWSSGFMPAAYQGTNLRSKGDPILDLSPKIQLTRRMQRETIDTLARLNAKHMESRIGYSELPARIASYELAYQLQTAAPEVMDVSNEDQRTLEMYGLFEPKPKEKKSIGPQTFGQQCLTARRLVERGVRFVQIYSGGGHGAENWDAHGNVEKNLAIHAPEIDKPIHGLLTDLKQRGLLDETLVVWGGEFGRQPTSQGSGGRDHNAKGFLYWLAGGGVKGGHSHGETDPLGHEAAVDRHHIRDLHSTILHLMGLDHHKLTYFYGGLDHRLTGVEEAEVIHDLIA